MCLMRVWVWQEASERRRFPGPGLQPGEVCLIHAAAGGVSLTAVQIAKALGAIVIATCSPGKFAVAKRFGAEYTVDYTRKEWIEEVKRICKTLKKGGVDVV